MKKQYKERNKEFKNNFNSAIKVKIKDYNLKKKDYMIYTVENNMIYVLFPSAFIREKDLKPIISIQISYKPLWADDLLWDILGMQSNKNEPDSLRVIGAFTMISAIYQEYVVELENEEISTLEKTINDELAKFKKILPSLTENMYINEIKSSNTIGNVDKSLIYIHENNINEASRIIDKTDGNGRLGVGGKTYKELVREYINKLQSGRKTNNNDNTYIEYLNNVVTNLAKNEGDKKKQIMHDIFVSIMIFSPIIISPILIAAFNQTLIGILLMIICWGLLAAINKRKNINKTFYKIKDAHTKFNIINVDNEKIIKELYEDSALTFMAEPSDRLLDFIFNWLNNEDVLNSDSLNLYVFDGKLLKSTFEFSKVSNNMKFMSIFNKDLDINETNIKKFSHDHFQVKARWLDDIVNNDKDKIEPFELQSQNVNATLDDRAGKVYKTIIIKLDSKKLENPDLDIRYKLPERIEYITKNNVLDNGYDYLTDTELLIFLKSKELGEIYPIYRLFKDEKICNNDLSKCSEMFVSNEENADIDKCIRIDYNCLLACFDSNAIKDIVNVTDNDLDNIERDLNIKIPPKLREFYKKNNGKKIEPFAFNDDIKLVELFPLKYGRSVEYHKILWLDWLKEELIPLGRDEVDIEIYWSTKDNKAYRIDSEFEDNLENPVLVYDNVEDLISKLRIKK